MSTCGQTQPRAHERGVFDTPPYFVHSRGTGTKCILHATRENFALFKGARLGMWPAYDVWSCVCRACDRGVMCCQVEVAARCLLLLQPCALLMGLKTKMSGGFDGGLG
jgi:hypothetical protein